MIGVALWLVAIASAAAGAVLAVLPAVIIVLISLFYNSLGDVLTLIGTFLGLIPGNPLPSQGSGAPPVFPFLHVGMTVIVLRSVAATALGSVATFMLVTTRAIQPRGFWVGIGLCCVAAAVIGGHQAGLVLLPAIVVSVAGIAAPASVGPRPAVRHPEVR